MAVEGTPDEVLITPQVVMASKALDQIGAILQEEGVSLNELIEAGRHGRDVLLRELQGSERVSQTDSHSL